MPYHHDTSPYWGNDDVTDLYQDHAHRRGDNVMIMAGVFRPALLPDYTYEHRFIPTDDGQPTRVIPVFDECKVSDIVAVGDKVWGCVSGRAAVLGTFGDPLRVYKHPTSWMAGGLGILPLKYSWREGR
jgi:hypothetical protein